jgi:hypothetical protein
MDENPVEATPRNDSSTSNVEVDIRCDTCITALWICGRAALHLAVTPIFEDVVVNVVLKAGGIGSGRNSNRRQDSGKKEHNKAGQDQPKDFHSGVG